MEMPLRVPQHISETAGYKIFSSAIPDYWIIRDVTERDYGIDCYIEIVSDDHKLTGDLVSVQLKSQKAMTWNDGSSTVSGIKISTTNYWYLFAVPVFIFIVDLEKREVYFQSVSDYVKRNYAAYNVQGIFSYKIDKSNLFDSKDGSTRFQIEYYKDRLRKEFEDNIISFLASYHLYIDFHRENIHLDVFLDVEPATSLFARQFYNNVKFLADYLEIGWDLSAFSEYEKQGQKMFGDHGLLYNRQLHEIVTKLNRLQLLILKQLEQIITETEAGFGWTATSPCLIMSPLLLIRMNLTDLRCQASIAATSQRSIY